MKRRYALDANSGLLVDRDGDVLGRVVSLTLDDRPAGGQGGAVGVGGEPAASTSPRTEEQGGGVGEALRPTASQLEREAIERIWAYYIERIPSRRQLGDKQRRQIRAALAVRSEEEIKCAIDGIAVSPHHRGENDRRKRYQDLHYAIVPRGEESIEERIDKAIGWAKEFGGPGASIDPDRANRWLEDIRTFLARRANNPAATAGLDRAKEAYENARAAGLAVLKVNGPPWARYAE